MMEFAYWCYWYKKALAQTSGAERAECEKNGKHCAICKDCELRRSAEVRT